MAKVVTRPRSSSRSSKRSSSCWAYSGFVFDRWTGFLWVKDVKGEVAERFNDGGLEVLLVIRDECAAEKFKGIMEDECLEKEEGVDWMRWTSSQRRRR